MIHFPQTYDEAISAAGELCAGAVDLQERYRRGVSAGPLIDLRRLTGLNTTTNAEDGSWQIGAMVPLATLLRNPICQKTYPGLCQAMTHIATPQIRNVATVGGNLWQHPHCWYYRHPSFNCYRKGGQDCPARNGNHMYSVCFDSGPCIAPHPSTLALAFLAYDGSLRFYKESPRSLLEYFQQEDLLSTHQVPDSHPFCLGVQLPSPQEGERASYRRVSGRALADWPLVEALIRLQVKQDTISFARIVIGGVAPVPLRLVQVEKALLGQPARKEVLQEAAQLATAQANPLPGTSYKVQLVQELVADVLQTLLSSSEEAD